MSLTPTPQIAEIVTFRLKDGVEMDRFLEDAKTTEDVLATVPGYVRRHLSMGEDGSWTDLILWTSMDSAKQAAKSVVEHPDFAPFGSAIQGESVVMRHEKIELNME